MKEEHTAASGANNELPSVETTAGMVYGAGERKEQESRRGRR